MCSAVGALTLGGLDYYCWQTEQRWLPVQSIEAEPLVVVAVAVAVEVVEVEVAVAVAVDH